VELRRRASAAHKLALMKAWVLLVAALSLTAWLTLGASAQAADPQIAAAGDVACGGYPTTLASCQQGPTSDLLLERPRSAVLMLGDAQYPNGAADLFGQFYEPTWGRVKSLTRPVPGNHEYGTDGAAGYFSYFGAAAGPVGLGYYSFDVGAWHVVALNSNCAAVGGCGAGSPEETWLRSDLAATRSDCTLAFWHHPHFSSGSAGNDDHGVNPTGAFWDDLYAAGADLVLNGHDHDYERFAPQSPIGIADPAYGIREFVVGTGGRSHSSFQGDALNSERRNSRSFGVLELGLHPRSYGWRFVSVHGNPYTDIGTGRCHGSPSEPLLRLNARRHVRLSRAGSLTLLARCAASCSANAQATVIVGRRKLRSLRINRSLFPQVPMKMHIKFSRPRLRSIRNALRRHRRLRAEITALANAAAVRTATARRTIRLRR
jgi:acid phosphatase type 7